VQHFILEKAREMKLRKIPQLMPDDATRLMDYEWPGNIRELENTVERALILNKGQFLTFEDFPFNQMKEPSYTGELPTPSLTLPLDTVISKYIQDTLAITKGKIYGKGGAAELLSVNPSTLRHRMKKLGITSKKTYYQSH
jgi:DNA-binding NtrC family response regulator